MTIQADLQSLSPTALLTFYSLDYTNLPGGTVLNFHAGTNGLSQPVVWQGVTYTPFPVDAEGFNVTGKGTMPRPKLRVSNINGVLSYTVKQFDDFVGAKVTRKRTFLKYLDAVNFPGPRNLLTYSNAFSNWTATNAIVTSNVITGPDGNVTGDKLIATAISGQHYISRGSLLANTKYAISVKAKAGEQTILGICAAYNSGGSVFNLANGTVTQGFGTATIEALSDGWYLCTALITPTVATQVLLQLGGNAATFTGNNISGLYLRDAQVELGTRTDYQENEASFNQNPTADPNQYLPDDLWFVERKLSENRQMIEFELSSAFDLMGQKLPNRQIIQNSCPWKYRGTECGWAGTNFDINNAPSTLANDVCAKTLTACRTRFADASQPIRFGGFPGAVRGTT